MFTAPRRINPGTAVAVILLLELIWDVGSYVIGLRAPGPAAAGLRMNNFLFSLAMFALIALVYGNALAQRTRRLAMPRNPVLLAALFIAFVAMPLGGYGNNDDWQGTLVWVAVKIPIAAVSEEIVFRGTLQTCLEKVMHPAAAIVLATATFVAVHAQSIRMDALHISAIAVGGVIFGTIFQRARDLRLVILIHAVFDWVLCFPEPALIGESGVIAMNWAAVVAAFAGWFADSRAAARAATAP